MVFNTRLWSVAITFKKSFKLSVQLECSHNYLLVISMKKSVFLLVVTTTFLASCSVLKVNPTYTFENLEKKPTSKVRFYFSDKKSYGKSLNIYTLTNSECSGAKKVKTLSKSIKLSGGGISSKDADLGMYKYPQPIYKKNWFVEIPVFANQKFEFSLAGSDLNKRCYVTAAFTPKEEGQYEVSFQQEKCTANVLEISNENNKFLTKSVPSFETSIKTCTAFFN